MTSNRTVLAAALVGGALLAPNAFAADGHVTYVADVSTYDRPLVMAASDRGIVFVGPGGELFRGFHHNQTAPDGVDQTFLWVEDIDRDDEVEFIGAGSPSFVVDSNADPMWGIGSGCMQFFVGDFIDDRNVEVLCRNERSVEVYSFDGQLYFEWSGGGWNIGTCHADDYDDDNQLEMYCELTSGNHLQFDFEYAEPEEQEGPYDPTNSPGVDRSQAQAAARGERELRMGSQSVTVTYSGGIVLSAGGTQIASVSVPTSNIYSATTADLDGNGTPELYVGGDDAVFVISNTGELIATVPANPSSFSREARVELRSATANGLENSDREAVAGVIEGEMDRLTRCYSDRMGSDQFTRVGTMLYELSVSDSGRVSNSQKRHSGLRNSSIESCVEGVLEGLTFSPASGGAGVVNVTLNFDFVDTP